MLLDMIDEKPCMNCFCFGTRRVKPKSMKREKKAGAACICLMFDVIEPCDMARREATEIETARARERVKKVCD